MNALKAILVMMSVAWLFCVSHSVYAAEPTEPPQVPLMPVEPEFPPTPEEVCADWPYCVISLNAITTQSNIGSATRFAR